MDQFWLELAKSSPTAAIIGLVVWWTMRDHGKILRSIDLRLAKVLERTRETPAFGTPTRHHNRPRSRSDSDDDPILPRTISQDLEDGDSKKKGR
jgi:hypothetical protein